MLKVTSAEIALSAAALKQFPKDKRYEIVLVGKSNVGKSSFINAVIGRNALARTSSSPGKTQTANFYLINKDFYFVDMPGYGYAKTSKQVKDNFVPLIETYLKNRNTDFTVFHLLDYRHPPTQEDIRMRKVITSNGIIPVSVFTKEDKLKRNERAKLFNTITETLGIGEDEAVFEFSTIKKPLIEEMQEFIGDLICSISEE